MSLGKMAYELLYPADQPAQGVSQVLFLSLQVHAFDVVQLLVDLGEEGGFGTEAVPPPARAVVHGGRLVQHYRLLMSYLYG